MTSGLGRVKTRGVVKLRNATAKELLNSIIHYHFGQTFNSESLKEISRPPSFTSALFSQTMPLKTPKIPTLMTKNLCLWHAQILLCIVLYSQRSLSHAMLRLGTDSLVLLMNVLKRKGEGLGRENQTQDET